MAVYQVKDGIIHAKRTDISRNSYYANGHTFQNGNVKKGGLVCFALVLLLYFPLLDLQVQDSSPLRMVETS